MKSTWKKNRRTFLALLHNRELALRKQCRTLRNLEPCDEAHLAGQPFGMEEAYRPSRDQYRQRSSIDSVAAWEEAKNKCHARPHLPCTGMPFDL